MTDPTEYRAPLFEEAEYRVTFGQQYPREPHPKWPPAHRDGWVKIMAPNLNLARAAAFEILGRWWAFIYGPQADNSIDDVDWSLFPRGEIGRIVRHANGVSWVIQEPA